MVILLHAIKIIVTLSYLVHDFLSCSLLRQKVRHWFLYWWITIRHNMSGLENRPMRMADSWYIVCFLFIFFRSYVHHLLHNHYIISWHGISLSQLNTVIRKFKIKNILCKMNKRKSYLTSLIKYLKRADVNSLIIKGAASA